ncbi:PH domain-containing protein [Nocardia wallacei]|uniref:Membrane protein n=1 Tax=Nocardia wallacei TaxID=480035 RepID=A0A7G1KJ50_9NOCA|nr:PH domain-containing protein [Nocardia wallacei]BCK53434.1 membrane protein [Nocardia wallacei]
MAQPSDPPAAGDTIMAEPAWRPSPRARLLWALGPAIGWAIVLIAELIWLGVDSAHRAAQAAVVAATLVSAAVSVVAVPLWRYAVHRWEVTGEAVYTRTGWLTQESRVAPITRVQTVDTQRGPLERLLGLATVTVTTASSAGAVRISALDRPVAEQTVARLTRIAARHRGDAT